MRKHQYEDGVNEGGGGGGEETSSEGGRRKTELVSLSFKKRSVTERNGGKTSPERG